MIFDQFDGVFDFVFGLDPGLLHILEERFEIFAVLYALALLISEHVCIV
jgi:hypothetical protein